MHSPPYYDYKSNILNVIIHNVTRIGDNAFSNCINLMNVSISSTVASIGEAAFSSCESLNHLSVPNNVSEIGAMAF